MSVSRISVRSYTDRFQSHSHTYHQLVLPLHGTIEIDVGNFRGLVRQGDCVIIKAGQKHDFRANAKACFIVVDSQCLPDNIMCSEQENVAIDAPLLAFIQFLEIQLQHQVNTSIEREVFDLFYNLLAQQSLANKVDKRIQKVISVVGQDIAKSYTNEVLADIACLSATQFKKVFRESTGLSCQRYVTTLRMQKAKALLSHTDTPINIVAQLCGYQNPSAFSRKFKEYFGESPREFVG